MGPVRPHPAAGPPEPLHPRVLAVLVLAVGVVALGINEWMATSQREILVITLLVGPTVTLLGLAGLWEPRVIWSLGALRRQLPAHVRILGVAIITLGVLTSAWLSWSRWRIWP